MVTGDVLVAVTDLCLVCFDVLVGTEFCSLFDW